MCYKNAKLAIEMLNDDISIVGWTNTNTNTSSRKWNDAQQYIGKL
jgi:hypothetical protein